MSRAYKDALVDEAADLGGTCLSAANAEKLSGADLEQMRLAALNGRTPSTDANGTKTLGTNPAFTGSPNCAALSGADMERYAGSQ